MNAYDKSNSIEAVKLSRLSHKEYKAVLSATESISDRQKQAQALCDYQTLKINWSNMNEDDWIDVIDDQERERIMNEYLSYMMGVDPE